jgi:hypothetical protein
MTYVTFILMQVFTVFFAQSLRVREKDFQMFSLKQLGAIAVIFSLLFGCFFFGKDLVNCTSLTGK